VTDLDKGKKNKVCIDCGSKYCPCHLAYSGDCIKCSMIRGEKICDCQWQGVCIYNEVMHNKKGLVQEREEYLCTILDKNEVLDGLFLLKIKVPKKIVDDLSSVGSYILLKSKNKEDSIYNAPISVMDVDRDKNILEVVIKKVGIKTKYILESEEVIVKAPYFNGIFGIDKINKTHKSNCVVILNGLSQVNSINVVKKLINNDNKVEVFLYKNSIKLKQVEEKLNNLGVNIHIIDIEEDKNLIIDYMKRNNVTLVYSGASNRFSKTVKDIVDIVSKDIALAISNNNLICCGEGICGACTINLNGEQVKTCKTQVNSRDFFRIM